jgi:hypothetical protein
MNFELAIGEQALVRLRRIQLPTSNGKGLTSNIQLSTSNVEQEKMNVVNRAFNIRPERTLEVNVIFLPFGRLDFVKQIKNGEMGGQGENY